MGDIVNVLDDAQGVMCIALFLGLCHNISELVDLIVQCPLIAMDDTFPGIDAVMTLGRLNDVALLMLDSGMIRVHRCSNLEKIES